MSSVPVAESCGHVLVEFDCLDPLLAALRLDSGRLKCTCLAVSRKWLALGTSAGGLHLIQREGWKQRLILTHKEGSITQMACCPHDEDFVAVATSQGLVVVWELQLERRGRPERVCVSWEHRGQAVTALCWDNVALRVFVGDAGGKVSFVRAGSSKLGKGAGFVIFPVQTITTVDSRVVQLGYMDGRLLVSSLSRCYLCDTEREKFWRVGNKERDGEFGACFFPQGRGLMGGQSPLLYCARPGSRIWEASFNGEVLSTHQFKQLLACPPVPIISNRCEPQYSPAQRGPQSMAFPRLLYLSDQNLLTWTDSAIYIFVPQSGQVLLWSEIKDVMEIVVFRSELFCLHGDGHLSHLLLLPVERCTERLLRRENWVLAATVCCMFQNAITPCRVRKSLPIDRLENLRSQLNSSTHQHLISQLEEVISKLEPLDSASSSRRSSISSHESFNVLDCGIYRVISRRSSQSDEETSSLISQSMLEEERLKEFTFVQEDEPMEQASCAVFICIIISHSTSISAPTNHPNPPDPPSERTEPDRPDLGLHFHLPLPFRPKPPRATLQAVRDSVSSFVKKTTEKINTLQMNSDLWPRPDQREGGVSEAVVSTAVFSEEVNAELNAERHSADIDLQELREATERAISQVQDPMVLFDPACLGDVLREWLLVLERVLGTVVPQSEDERPPSVENLSGEGCEDEQEGQAAEGMATQLNQEAQDESRLGPGGGEEGPPVESMAFLEPVRVWSPQPLPSDLQADLYQLASLSLDLGCFRDNSTWETGKGGETGGVCSFLHHYFFLLDPEHVRHACLVRYKDQPEVHTTYVAGLRELSQTSPMVEVIERGDLLKSLRSLREMQPWTAPPLLAHLHRLYKKHGELALRSFTQFYPTILPSDIMALAQKRHFLAYLDNLIQSRAEEQRLSFLGSLLQPECLRQDWLELALSHDAPPKADTLTADGQPRWCSHLFSWGYGRLLSLLIHLPADLESKKKMAETCRTFGYWSGYLSLCCQLQRRSEAFSTICRLDDLALLEGPNGVSPETLEEWKLLLQLSQHRDHAPDPASNGSALPNGSWDWSSQVSPENLTLRLARVVGPDRALATLQECGIRVELGPHSALVCELLRIAERRQRALIQTMLERCDRFLWSQQA
ncbi:Hermansky-Pudlak syndrome 5 protein isoform X1 [Megalops cyprinoides]|uniref:Hermansky-Pudlak syndrome 5 protein isoform X1 n=1 Tax=Megalops cyprinoides TaxID=118141 RepID=UPI001864947A|nr:Hermansky-Pudlak syndrome 5 protein isoform X1 [Megalops cyprinoides]